MIRSYRGVLPGRRAAKPAPLDLAPRLGALIAGDAPPETAYRRASARSGHGIWARTFRGHPKHCPVCRGRFGHFHDFGLARRRNAACPGCGSLERHRFLWLYLDNALRVTGRRLTVLHVAPEPGIRDRLRDLPNLRYTDIDLFRPDASRAMDVTRLALPDSSVDLVICSHVLEHVERDREALGEFARVLRPGGRALILVPLDRRRPTVEDPSARTVAERLAAFGHPYHVRICGADYGDRIAAAGFTVRRADAGAISGHRRRYFRLNKASLFDCQRTAQPAGTQTARRRDASGPPEFAIA